MGAMKDLATSILLSQDWSLRTELDTAINDGQFEKYLTRATLESELYEFGESCDWDREKVISYCLSGTSGWFGRKGFEKAFEDGSMKEMSKTYHETLLKYNKLL